MADPATIDLAGLSSSRVELLHHALAACGRNGLEATAAEDLVQNAIIELFNAQERGTLPDCPQIAFLKQTIEKRAIDKIRETRRHSALLREHRESTPQPRIARDDEARECAEVAQRIFSELLRAVEEKKDEDAWCYLVAIENDPDAKREILIAASELTPERFEAAKKRVAVLLKHVTPELRQNAHSILGISGKKKRQE